jgi:hypothetical protein
MRLKRAGSLRTPVGRLRIAMPMPALRLPRFHRRKSPSQAAAWLGAKAWTENT